MQVKHCLWLSVAVKADPPYAQDNQIAICPPQDADNTQVS